MYVRKLEKIFFDIDFWQIELRAHLHRANNNDNDNNNNNNNDDDEFTKSGKAKQV